MPALANGTNGSAIAGAESFAFAAVAADFST